MKMKNQLTKLNDVYIICRKNNIDPLTLVPLNFSNPCPNVASSFQFEKS